MLPHRLLYYSFIAAFFFLPIATAPGVIFAVLALLIWTFSGICWKERQQWVFQPWFVPVLILCLLPWFGLLYTENLYYGLKVAKKSYLWLCTFAIASLSFNERETPRNLLNAFLVGLAVTATVSILQATDIFHRSLGSLLPHKGFPVGFLDLTGHISLSLFLVLGILMLSFYAKEKLPPKIRVIVIIGLFIFFIDLRLVQGRTGYLAFLLLSPVLFYNLFGRKKWIFVSLGILIAILGLLVSPTVQHRVQEVVNQIKLFEQGNPETSIGNRLYIWQGAVLVLKEHPIFGVGTGDFGTEMKRLQDAGILPPISVSIDHSFNTFLSFAVSYGMASVLILIWLLWLLIKKGSEFQHTEIGFFILMYTLIFIIGSFTDMLLIRHQTVYLFALIVGLQAALVNRKESAG